LKELFIVRKLFVSVAVLLIAGGCSSELPQIVGCEAVGDIRPVCDMQTPEDIAALDDDRHLLLAHFGHMGKATGSISLFDTRTEMRTPLYPDGEALVEATPGWGDASCVEPPGETLGPHGTHLHQLEGGRWRYLVVNHGARESIEVFELLQAGADSSLVWRGCVIATAATLVNDVVGLANGDLILSQMTETADSNLEMIKGMLGFPTGSLWRWRQGSGLEPMVGTEAAGPNGLEISADGRYVFADMYLEGEIWKIDVDSGQKIAVAEVANADNSAWAPDGRLWLATHRYEGLEFLDCLGNMSRSCGVKFEIVALDPDTMETEVVFAHSGPPMGAATIAVHQAGRVYMGSFAGDRLISVPLF